MTKYEKGHARLKFNIKNLKLEKIEKIHQATVLLHEAGVSFDFGSDDNFIDWELDWSLENAIVEVRIIEEEK